MKGKSVAAVLVALWIAQDAAAQMAQTPGESATPAYGSETESAPEESATPVPRVSMINPDRPQLQLSLAEAIELALTKNLNTRVDEVSRVQALAQVEGSKSGFDPFFTSSLDASGGQTSTTSGLQSTGGQVVSKDLTGRASISEALPIGGSVSVTAQSDRSDSNSRFTLLPVAYSSSLVASVTYPLFRNRGNLSLKTPIDVAKQNLELSDLQLRNDVIALISTVQNDYLDLVLAKETLKIQQQSLDLARSQLDIARAQERVGTLAPIEVLSSEAAVAASDENLINAESGVLQAEDTLRTTLNLPESLGLWNVAIIPTDNPGFPEEAYDFSAAVEQALKTRPDYQQAILNLKVLRLNLGLSRDEVRPQIDLSGSWGFVGNSQLETAPNPDPNGQPITIAQGGIFTSHLEDLLSLNNFQWTLGVSIRQPFGNRAALSQYRTDKLQVEKALLQLRNLELNIVSQVRTLLRAIETSRQRLAAARIATELERRRLEAEQKKFEVGTSTSFNVSQFQERYVAAETAQTQALIDLNRAVLSLQQTVGKTLEVNGVQIKDGHVILGTEPTPEPAASPSPTPEASPAPASATPTPTP